MSGKRPKYTRTPDGGLLSMSCYEICRFWAEEDEFEGRNHDAETWRDAAELQTWHRIRIVLVSQPLHRKTIEKRGRQNGKEATSLGTNGICTKKPNDDNIKQQLRRQP
jgi:hypothetical protein